MAERAKISEQYKGARSLARLAAVQALYQMDIAATDFDTVLEEFQKIRIDWDICEGGCFGADCEMLSDIVCGVVRDQLVIDRMLNTTLAEGWNLVRLDATARAILRAGGYELYARDDIPARVVISEYIDLAHAFFYENEPRFINAALDRFARQYRLEEMK